MLTGEATFLGYNVLNDTAVHLVLVDHLAQRGDNAHPGNDDATAHVICDLQFAICNPFQTPERNTPMSNISATAVKTLRDRFAAADVGISGVNFAVAETGTIVIVENEGNIRLTTSLPRVHIAVMGIEKVIPHFADLDVFLKLLPRSGTGQRLTTYQSFITGTKRTPADEGPEALHIVLLDNGRSRRMVS